MSQARGQQPCWSVLLSTCARLQAEACPSVNAWMDACPCKPSSGVLAAAAQLRPVVKYRRNMNSICCIRCFESSKYLCSDTCNADVQPAKS